MGMSERSILNVDLGSFVLSSKCGQRPWSPPPLSGQYVAIYRLKKISLVG